MLKNKVPFLMKKSVLIGAFVLGMSMQVLAQEVDITQVVADTKSFTFNDAANTTVKDYIFSQLEGKTTCCGSDRIYLEVRIHPSGYVTEAKTLTGKNDCMKQSAMDIVKNIKWDAKDFKGTRPVYFEIRPNISCEGERTNTYAMIPVTHNELLDETGKKLDPNTGTEIVLGTRPGQAAQEKEAEAPAETPAEEATQAGTDTEETAQPTATDQVAATESQTPDETPTPAAPEEEEKKQEETPIIVKSPSAGQKPTQSPGQPAVVRGTSTEEEKATDEAVAAAQAPSPEEQAKKEEVEMLQDELADLRQREERIREERRKRLEERRKQIQAQQEAQENYPDPFANDQQKEIAQNDPFGNNAAATSQEVGGQDELSRLERERTEMENRRRQLEDSRRRDAQEQERILRDLLRVEEDILQKEEEIKRQQEQAELDRLIAEKQQLEDQRLQMDGEVQRLVAEIQRLQQELNRKIAELELQDQNVQQKTSDIAQREQEINAQRALRDQQMQTELSLKRRQAELTIVGLSAPGANVSTIDPSLMAQGDSTGNTAFLVQQIILLQQEIDRLKGNPAATPGIDLPEGAKRADQDQSWRDINYNAPQGTPAPATGQTGYTGTTVTDPNYQGEGYQPGIGYSPAPGHRDTYTNTSGPVFRNVQYGAGQNAMNRFIADQLKIGGVCGLAQAFAEVTVDPSGRVTAQKVLKANSTEVITLLPAILRTLQFQPTLSKVPQIAYIEFKANIRCGATDGTAGNSVNSLVNQQGQE